MHAASKHVLPLDSFWRCSVVGFLSVNHLWVTLAACRLGPRVRWWVVVNEAASSDGRRPLRLLLLLLLLLQVGSPHGQVHPHDVASHDLGGEQSRGRPALRRKFTRSAGGVYTHLINIRSLSGSTETTKAAAKLMERSSGDQNTRRCCSRLTQVNRVIMGSRAEPGWADGE